MSPLHRAEVAEWQTRGIQNPVSLTGVWVRLPPSALFADAITLSQNVLGTPVVRGFRVSGGRMHRQSATVRFVIAKMSSKPPCLCYSADSLSERPCGGNESAADEEAGLVAGEFGRAAGDDLLDDRPHGEGGSARVAVQIGEGGL